MAQFATVAVAEITYWVDRPYAYALPLSLQETVCPGMRLSVPFSRTNRKTEAICLSVSDETDVPAEKLKTVLAQLDPEPILQPWQIQLALWMRARFFCTVFDAVRAMLPTGLWFRPDGKRRAGDKTQEIATLNVEPEEAQILYEARHRRAKQQAAILQVLIGMGRAPVTDIAAITGAGRGSFKALEKEAVITLSREETFRRPRFEKGPARSLPVLNEEQRKAFDGLYQLSLTGTAQVALLYGVTGSGKTTVYMHLIYHVLARGKSALMLVPEIALTPQMLEIFSACFGEQVAVLHSSLPTAERYDEWKRARTGDAKLVIGTRSAVFAPLENLGVIILDEEQEETYKSQVNPRYHARDVAKYLSIQHGSLLVLGSATPDVESRYSAEQGVYALFRLERRYNRMELPRVRIVDMRKELQDGNETSISRVLRDELAHNISCGEQSILFLNRRGSARIVTCMACGFVQQCPNCSVNLTYHSDGEKLVCHYCGLVRPVARVCPQCGGPLRYTGDGTQKIEEQLIHLYGEQNILRMDTDTVSKTGSHEALLKRFRDEHIPIMVGTKMVTKGLNFSDVTLVGVLTADQSLYASDYRASERTFSLITQVIGRSGRAERPGRAIIQTFTPEHPVIRFAAQQDYERFYHSEIQLRKAQCSPPFTQIIELCADGRIEDNVRRSLGVLASMLHKGLGGQADVRVLGPAPCPVVKVNCHYRYRVTLAGPTGPEVRSMVARVLYYGNTDKRFQGVSFYADLNPV